MSYSIALAPSSIVVRLKTNSAADSLAVISAGSDVATVSV